ncbi:peptidase, A24 family [Corynebacterium efficiens YS-314]|uniref:prepilin peptidase n=1 Tax=Corynebacterium efficiens TaxID=152794 RepID=UPI0001B86E80|nr:A24 family peptidase [Corynebacterium efficiens]EEW51114.1 peptidase, A24 family [Corynebacterium efficiens YS-314]
MLLTALLTAVAAALLSGQISPFVPEPSRWVRARFHVVLAAALGAGAALLATNPAELIGLAAAAVGCTLLMVIDLAVCRLPDRLVAATLLALVLGFLASAAVGGTWNDWVRALLAGLVLLLGYFALAFIAPAGLGLGDVKFAAVVGVFLGWFSWQHVAIGTLLAFVLNVVVAVAVLLTRCGNRKTDIPFGPWMVAGAVLAVVLL